MPPRRRPVAGTLCCLVAAATIAFLVLGASRFGVRDMVEGWKGVLYGWFLVLGAVLPFTAAVGMFRGRRSRRVFWGVALVAFGTMTFRPLWLMAPRYRLVPDLAVCALGCGLLPVLCGGYLLVRAATGGGRNGREGRRPG